MVTFDVDLFIYYKITNGDDKKLCFSCAVGAVLRGEKVSVVIDQDYGDYDTRDKDCDICGCYLLG